MASVFSVALHSLYCADVLLRNCSLTQSNAITCQHAQDFPITHVLYKKSCMHCCSSA